MKRNHTREFALLLTFWVPVVYVMLVYSNGSFNPWLWSTFHRYILATLPFLGALYTSAVMSPEFFYGSAKDKTLKFGIDIHGVLDTDPTIRELCKKLMDAGHEVHILTGPTEDLALEHLEQLAVKEGVHYSHLFSIADQLLSKGLDATWKDSNNPLFEDEPWDRAKADYCKEEGITLHIDDSPVYGKYFNMDTTYIQVGGRKNRT